MADINTIEGLNSAPTLRAFAQQASTRPAVDQDGNIATAEDSVEISELARLLSRLADLPADRARQIVDIRNAINSGTYLTADKLDVATDRLLGEFQATEFVGSAI